MMFFRSLALVLATTIALGVRPVYAIPVVQILQDSTDSGLDRYSFSVDAAGNVYDTIEIVIQGVLNQVEQVPGAVIFVENSEDTDFLGLTTIAEGAIAIAAEDSEERFSGVLGVSAPLLISTELAPGTNFFQAVLPAGGSATYEVNYLHHGSFLDPLQSRGVLGIPEPSTLALAGLGMVGLLGRRSRTLVRSGRE